MLPARLPQKYIPTLYAWIAPTHDWLAVLVEAKARALALRWADIQEGERVLEVAVGTGLSFVHLLRSNTTGWTDGVDLSPAMLRRALRRARRAPTNRWTLRHGDAHALDFPDATFDVLINSYMFDLLPVTHFVPVLQEYKRVLKPDGRLIMINMTVGLRPVERIWEALYRLWPPLLGGCRGVLVEPFLHKAGFVNTRRRYVSQRTFPSEVLFAEKLA